MLNWFKNLFKTEEKPALKVEPLKAEIKPIDNKIPTLTLSRVYEKEQCVLGELCSKDGCFTIKTLELPYKENQPKISSIPNGLYYCEHFDGTRFREVWQVKNVKGRSAILLHSGNISDDIEGCILVGTRYGTLGSKTAVLNSREALERLKLYIGKENGKLKPFFLNIVTT